jgi:hypothetical protein
MTISQPYITSLARLASIRSLSLQAGFPDCLFCRVKGVFNRNRPTSVARAAADIFHPQKPNGLGCS